MLHLPGHHDFRDLFALEDFDELAELADVDPVKRRSVLRDFGRSFVFNCNDDDVVSFAICVLKREQREPAVTGDDGVALG